MLSAEHQDLGNSKQKQGERRCGGGRGGGGGGEGGGGGQSETWLDFSLSVQLLWSVLEWCGGSSQAWKLRDLGSTLTLTSYQHPATD